MGDRHEQEPPGGPEHRTARCHGEPVGHDERREGEQRPQDGVHAQRVLDPPVQDHRHGAQHAYGGYEQQQSAHDDDGRQHDEERERPVPPSLRDNIADPRGGVAEPSPDRGELPGARVGPFGQYGREGMPPAPHDDGEQRHRERAHAHTQREQDPFVPLTLAFGFLPEPSAFRRGLPSDLFGDVLAYPFPFVVEFLPVGFEPGFVLSERGLAFEDALTAFFPFDAGAFPFLGFLEQFRGLVEFGELFPERPIR